MVGRTMKLQRTEIRDFRNHAASVLDFANGINAIFGDNGEGKTNIVEAISYLCLTKSFYASSDALVVRIGSERFDVRGSFEADSGMQSSVAASYEASTAKKTMTVNKAPVETLSSIVGQFPAVILSPEQNGITFGAPTERRKFLDLAISQASKLYLEEILEYRRILRQRNKILLDARLARRDCTDLLEPWDESLLRTGTSIMMRRAKFVEDFRPLVEKQFSVVAAEGERPGIEYVPSFEGLASWTREAVEERFAEELRIHSDEERKTGTTAVGPHRDELEFCIDDLSLRKYASQGQHKTFLVALKLAEFSYLKDQQNETPILVLDDVFSELDEHRSGRLLDLTGNVGQVFITATDDRAFGSGFKWDANHRRFLVQQGTVREHAKAQVLVN
jgi:DNA replication and repair protein RecF